MTLVEATKHRYDDDDDVDAMRAGQRRVNVALIQNTHTVMRVRVRVREREGEHAKNQLRDVLATARLEP